jgi:hypothetical protein
MAMGSSRSAWVFLPKQAHRLLRGGPLSCADAPWLVVPGRAYCKITGSGISRSHTSSVSAR